ncbi:MAG: trypsin-like peptidase domain-containing protein [Bradymonadia bacterium]
MRISSRALTMPLACVALTLCLNPASAQRLWTEGALETGIRPDSPVTFDAFSKLARKAAPAVVSVETEIVNAARGRGNIPDWFFEGPGAPERRGVGAGSGFVIRKDGYMLSNNHVVEGARSISVHFQDGAHYKASVVGTDPATDVALLKIELPPGKQVPVVPLGDSHALEIGEWVVAIGNPLGLSHTVTSGIVSAKERRGVRPDGRLRYANFIQTDASINPGNSGGPLFNIRGEVVGINTAISAQGQGIGFAIPINMVKKLLPDLEADGKVSRSWIGIEIQAVTDKLARSFGLDRPRGALVAGVSPGSPADKAGLQTGDIILEFDGAQIRRHDDLPWLASVAGVGRTVTLEVMRERRKTEVKLTLARMPGEDSKVSMSRDRRSPRPRGRAVAPAVGLTLEQPEGAANGDGGAQISRVDPGSSADEEGLRAGDIILKLNGKKVMSPQSIARQLDGLEPGEIARLFVSRKGRRLYFTLSR